jgi:hypothetical protein
MLRLKDFIAKNIDPETLARLIRSESATLPSGLSGSADGP